MRIIVYFYVGKGSERARCRLVINGGRAPRAIEILDQDQLGDPRWVQAKNLGADAAVITERALVKIVEGLDKACVLGNIGDPFYPDGVTKTDRGFEVELGGVL